MKMDFSKDELAMVYQYAAGTKEDTLAGLKEIVPVIRDRQTREIVESTIRKLDAIPEPECRRFIADTEAAPKTVSSPSDRGVEIASKEIMASNEKGETNMEKVISIEGMACMHCVNHVQQALSAVPGVKEAKVDLESKSATVSVDGSVTDAALKAAVDEAGYQAVSIR